MLNDISPVAGATLAGTRAVARPEARQAGVPVPSTVAATPRRATDPVRAWERATQIAASTMFAGREVEVTSFHDQRSGRIVCRSRSVRQRQQTSALFPVRLGRFDWRNRAYDPSPGKNGEA